MLYYLFCFASLLYLLLQGLAYITSPEHVGLKGKNLYIGQ